MKIRLLLCAMSLAALPLPVQQPASSSIRDELTAVYGTWSKARTSLDKETIEKMLAPDFFVQLGAKRISRDDFIVQVTQPPKGARMTRFDSRILTLNPDSNSWIAVITEKLELELEGADGKPAHAYSLWVTKDRFSKESGAWLVLSSEAIGWENWTGGKEPPFSDWKS